LNHLPEDYVASSVPLSSDDHAAPATRKLALAWRSSYAEATEKE
jgi:hypothetical protein